MCRRAVQDDCSFPRSCSLLSIHYISSRYRRRSLIGTLMDLFGTGELIVRAHSSHSSGLGQGRVFNINPGISISHSESNLMDCRSSYASRITLLSHRSSYVTQRLNQAVQPCLSREKQFLLQLRRHWLPVSTWPIHRHQIIHMIILVKNCSKCSNNSLFAC